MSTKITTPFSDGSTWPVISVDVSGNYAPIGGTGTIGNVSGPASSLDEAITRFDGVTGKLIQGQSNTFLNDSGNIYCNSGTQIFLDATSAASSIALTADNVISIQSNNSNVAVQSLNGSFSVNTSGNATITSSNGFGVVQGTDLFMQGTTGGATINCAQNFSSTVGTTWGIVSQSGIQITDGLHTNITSSDTTEMSLVYSPAGYTSELLLQGNQAIVSVAGLGGSSSLTLGGGVVINAGSFVPSASGSWVFGTKALPYSGVVAGDLVTKSANGAYWKLTVSNTGVVTGTAF